MLAILGLNTACGQQTYEVDVFTTKSGKTVKFHALMHSCIRIKYDGFDIQIDPVPEPKDPCFWGCPPYRPHGNPDDFGGGTLSEEDSDFDIVPEEYIPPEPPSASQ